MSVGHWPSMMRTPSLSTNRQSVASRQLIWKPSTSWKYWALRLMSGTASTKAHGAIFDCMLGDSLLFVSIGPQHRIWRHPWCDGKADKTNPTESEASGDNPFGPKLSPVS